jgi:hypothetical protein
VKLHGRYHRAFSSDAFHSPCDVFLNPLTATEVENTQLLLVDTSIRLVPVEHHNILPFLECFDVVGRLRHAVCVCVCMCVAVCVKVLVCA